MNTFRKLEDTKMTMFVTILLSILVVIANAAPTILPPTWTDYDVIVVGGGPAGLGALSALARIRRNALLIDSGEYRNAPTRLAHDVIGFDGKSYIQSFKFR